jgi:Uma2 family endonuclease
MVGTARQRRPATYEDLASVPAHQIGEIIDGDLYAWPRPGSRHARAAVQLDRSLGPPFDNGVGGPGGWWLLIEPELRLGPDTLVPDLAGWRRKRLPEFPDVASFTQAPDWVCEILSSSTEGVDRGRKLRVYARERVGHVWLLNPERRTLEVMQRQEERWLLVAVHEGDGSVRAEPFEAVELQLASLWSG